MWLEKLILEYLITKTNVTKEILFRNMKHFEKNIMKHFSRQPWFAIDDLVHVGDKWNLWKNLFLDVLDKHEPIMSKRVRNKGSVPWLTREIRNKIILRDQFKKKAISTNSHV